MRIRQDRINRAIAARVWPIGVVAGLLLAVAPPAPALMRGDATATLLSWQASIHDTLQQAADAPAAGVEYHVLAGEIALARNDMSEAAEQYAAALALNVRADRGLPAAGDLAERTAKIAITADRADLAYPAVRQWAERQPQDVAAQQAALELAFTNDDPQGVIYFAPRFAQALGTDEAARRTAYRRIASLLGANPGKADAAIAVARQIRQTAQDKTAAGYALALVAFEYGDIKTARAAIGPVIKKAPDWDEAELLAAFIDARDLKIHAARKRLAGLGGDAATRSGYHMRLARYLLSIGKDQAGIAEFRQAAELAPENSDTRFGLALAELSANRPKAAQPVLEKLVDDPDHGDAALYYLGQIAADRGDLDQAQSYYERVGDSDGSGDDDARFQARLSLAIVQARRGKLDAALNTIDALTQSRPAQKNRLLGVKAELLAEAGQAKRARKLYDEALAHQPGDPDLLYGRALANEKLADIPAAETDLKTILKAEPDNAAALNALGYLLTNHSSDYGRAEKLIRRALAQDPKDASMLDSLGWVEYKQGDLNAARKHLEQAYAGSEHPEIAAHLGRVRWAQGDHDAARAIWKKAFKAHPDDTDLKQLIKAHRA